MAKIKESYIDCGHCGMKFRSPFYIGDTKTFSQAIMWGTRVECPLCEVTIDCDERNMSYIMEAGEVPQRREEPSYPMAEAIDRYWTPV